MIGIATGPSKGGRRCCEVLEWADRTSVAFEIAAKGRSISRVDMPIAPHWMHSGDLRPRDALVRRGKTWQSTFCGMDDQAKSTAT